MTFARVTWSWLLKLQMSRSNETLGWWSMLKGTLYNDNQQKRAPLRKAQNLGGWRTMLTGTLYIGKSRIQCLFQQRTWHISQQGHKSHAYVVQHQPTWPCIQSGCFLFCRLSYSTLKKSTQDVWLDDDICGRDFANSKLSFGDSVILMCTFRAKTYTVRLWAHGASLHPSHFHGDSGLCLQHTSVKYCSLCYVYL